MESVKSTYSPFRIAIACFCIVFGLGLLNLGISSMLFRVGVAGDIFDKLNRYEEISSFSVAILFIWGASLILSAKYVVEQDGIHVRHWWRHHYISWEDVVSIHFLTNFGFGYTVSIKVKRGSMWNAKLSLATVGNGHKLGKSIIEAGSTANPNIRFLGAHEYGPPPYGIFTKE